MSVSPVLSTSASLDLYRPLLCLLIASLLLVQVGSLFYFSHFSRNKEIQTVVCLSRSAEHRRLEDLAFLFPTHDLSYFSPWSALQDAVHLNPFFLVLLRGVSSRWKWLAFTSSVSFSFLSPFGFPFSSLSSDMTHRRPAAADETAAYNGDLSLGFSHGYDANKRERSGGGRGRETETETRATRREDEVRE